MAERTAIDLNLEHPVLLQVTVSAHYRAEGERYFRAQPPPFLQRGAVYPNCGRRGPRSVHGDGMAMRQVPIRMGRDFAVRPSEGSIRRWCRTHGESFGSITDY